MVIYEITPGQSPFVVLLPTNIRTVLAFAGCTDQTVKWAWKMRNKMARKNAKFNWVEECLTSQE